MVRDSFLNRKFKYTYSNVSMYLVLVNILVFILVHYTSIGIKGVRLFYWLSLIPECVTGLGWVWQLFTYMFVHGSLTHLLFDMLALAMFGQIIERSLGSREFLLFYLLCGFLGGVLSYLFFVLQGTTHAVIMGASGSIYAVLFLAAVLFPRLEMLFFFVFPMKMPYAVMIYIAIEVASQLFGLADGVAHMIHLSCIAIAWLYVALRFRLNPIRVWKENL